MGSNSGGESSTSSIHSSSTRGVHKPTQTEQARGGCDPAAKAANHGAAALIDLGQGEMGRDRRACTAWLAGTEAWASPWRSRGGASKLACQATGLEEPCREWTRLLRVNATLNEPSRLVRSVVPLARSEQPQPLTLAHSWAARRISPLSPSRRQFYQTQPCPPHHL